MSLESLPLELHLGIIKSLKSLKDVNSLCQVSRQLNCMCVVSLYKRDAHATIDYHCDRLRCACMPRAAMHWAIENSSIPTARLAIQNGFDLKGPATRDITALAVSHGARPGMLRFLLQEGVDINFKGTDSRTALFHAVKRKDLASVALLLRNKADINERYFDEEFDLGYTVLHAVARRRHSARLIKLLLDFGADVNARTVTLQRTPLHFAVKAGRFKAAKLLITLHADARALDGHGCSALGVAISQHRVPRDFVEYFLSNGGDATDPCGIHHASSSRDLTTLSILLARGASPMASGHGCLPANAAIGLGKRNQALVIQTLQLLFDQGAHIQGPAYKSRSPLQAAAAAGQAEVVRYLIDKGADVNLSGTSWYSPLELAAKYAGLDVVKALVERGDKVSYSAITIAQSRMKRTTSEPGNAAVAAQIYEYLYPRRVPLFS